MSAFEGTASLRERDVTSCNHLRQRHPLHHEALLVCAWPGCPEGTRNRVIEVPVADGAGRTPVLGRFERETLPVQGARLSFRWRSAQ